MKILDHIVDDKIHKYLDNKILLKQNQLTFDDKHESFHNNKMINRNSEFDS